MPSHLSATDFWMTIAAFVAGVAMVGIAGYLERHPRQDLMPRLVPTTPLMFVGALVAVLAVVHLLNGFGIKTGR